LLLSEERMAVTHPALNAPSAGLLTVISDSGSASARVQGRR
jgi:hypothetical protein